MILKEVTFLNFNDVYCLLSFSEYHMISFHFLF